MNELLAGALVDEEPTYGCDCWCACYARCDKPDVVCGDCEKGEHLTDDSGGEG